MPASLRPRWWRVPSPTDPRLCSHGSPAVSRFLLVILMLAATAGAVVAYKDPEQVARASDSVSDLLRRRALSSGRAVQIARGQTGEFTLKARINSVTAQMVIDTGATWVVLTYETAK